MHTALTIAGSDSGGGAGIQADLKTFAALGVYGSSAITAVTAQNTLGVRGWEPIRPALVVSQIDAVVEDIVAEAVNIGMLATAPIVAAVGGAIGRLGLRRVVIDPVMIAKGGDRLLDADAVAALRALLAHAHVATPNIPEAEVLAGMPVRTLDDMHEAGRRILALGPRVVLIKGGHADGAESIDVACRAGGDFEVRGPRLPGPNTHGTGCTLSSAIAAFLARGLSDEDAVRAARTYLEGAIRHAPGIGHGHGPLDHMWRTTTSGAGGPQEL
jgi:hydroxymethylpyrimidine/phosphomethylpyrimidine kinase